MQSLPTEIVGQILEFLPASGVYAFILTNKEHYKQRMMVLKSFKREFKPIFGSDCIAPSMYTGSAVLRALLGETWSNTDIDIFTDREHVDGIYARLDGDGVVVQHEYPAHIYSVQRFERPDVHVDVITVGPGSHYNFSDQRDIQTRIANFDLGFCKSAFDGTTLTIHDPYKTLIERRGTKVWDRDDLLQHVMRKIKELRSEGWLTFDRISGAYSMFEEVGGKVLHHIMQMVCQGLTLRDMPCDQMSRTAWRIAKYARRGMHCMETKEEEVAMYVLAWIEQKYFNYQG